MKATCINITPCRGFENHPDCLGHSQSHCKLSLDKTYDVIKLWDPNKFPEENDVIELCETNKFPEGGAVIIILDDTNMKKYVPAYRFKFTE